MNQFFVNICILNMLHKLNVKFPEFPKISRIKFEQNTHDN